jgi:hypothetical protein
MDSFLHQLEIEFIYVILSIGTIKYDIAVLLGESLIIGASVFLAVHIST